VVKVECHTVGGYGTTVVPERTVTLVGDPTFPGPTLVRSTTAYPRPQSLRKIISVMW
jgi:hypothetical protein